LVLRLASSGRGSYIVAPIAAAVIIAIALVGDPYTLLVGTLVAVYGIAVVGLNLLVGYGGQISFGHNAFLALGGYGTAILTT
jgi:branched-chain amino acid transport system permease protein